MTISLEYLRKRLGWCPNVAAVGTDRRRYTPSDGEFELETAVGGERETVESVLVDYVDPRFVVWFSFAFLGYLVLFVICLLIPSLRHWFYVPLTLSIMGYAAMHFYRDTRRTELELFGDAFFVRCPPFGPLCFGKDAFRSVEVKETYLPVPRWVVVSLMLLVIATTSATLMGVRRYLNGFPVLPDFVFSVIYTAGFAVFMLELTHRAYLRLKYPGYLRMKLAVGGRLDVYAEDPERLAALLGAPR